MTFNVHIDHHLPKDSIYRVSDVSHEVSSIAALHESITFAAIEEHNRLFMRLRKPDFQRATNAWDSRKCVEFLDSVISELLVPHIILWASPRSRNIYVLDGAHRISVLRAWMTDDWGDGGNSRRYYARYDKAQINIAAGEVRELISQKIGTFRECKKLVQEYQENPKLSELRMNEREKALVKFYHRLEDGDGLKIHWATGDYEYAAKSFVRINRGGQHLDPLEVFLIDNRNNSFVRALMAIAGGDGEGDYWPETQAKEALEDFNNTATKIYRRLFEPSFDVPPTDVHQPLIPTSASIRTQQTLRQIMPLLLDGEVCITKPNLQNYFESHYPSVEDYSAIHQSTRLLHRIDDQLKHLASLSNNDNYSLDIVPLFYWYNLRGGFVSALCYGFVYWILGNGKLNPEEIRQRKLVFSGNRDRLEYVLHHKKQAIANLQNLRGAGLKSTVFFAEFFDKVIVLLHENREMKISDVSLNVDKIIETMLDGKSTVQTINEPAEKNISTRRSARNTSIDTHGKILRLFDSNPKCPICGGHVDWKRHHQLEHLTPYRKKPETSALGTVEAHQFCNNNGDIIKAYREGKTSLSLPKTEQKKIIQLLLFDPEEEWGSDSEFPDGGVFDENINDE